MRLQQYKDVLLECLVTLRHARELLVSGGEMKRTDLTLYDHVIAEAEAALKSPGPEVPSPTKGSAP